MPIYSYSHEECDTHWEGYQPLTTSEAPECEKCHQKMEKVFSSSKHIPASAFPFITKNITGKPVEVRSALHLEQLCKENGVSHRPDAAWLTKEYQGVDFFTGKQKYKESSGLGLPGCWV